VLQLPLKILQLYPHLHPRHIRGALLVDVTDHLLNLPGQLVHVGVVLSYRLGAGCIRVRGVSVADRDAEHFAQGEELSVVGDGAVDEEFVGMLEAVDHGADAEGFGRGGVRAAGVVEDEDEGHAPAEFG
jgi:hypothetical protein